MPNSSTFRLQYKLLLIKHTNKNLRYPWEAIQCFTLFRILLSRDVVSVLMSRSLDGLESYFRKVSVSYRKSNVSVSCPNISFARHFTLFFPRFLHLLQKLFVSNFDWSRPELLSMCCTSLLIYWEVLAVLAWVQWNLVATSSDKVRGRHSRHRDTAPVGCHHPSSWGCRQQVAGRTEAEVPRRHQWLEPAVRILR